MKVFSIELGRFVALMAVFSCSAMGFANASDSVDKEIVGEFYTSKDLISPKGPHNPKWICAGLLGSHFKVWCNIAGEDDPDGPAALLELDFIRKGTRHQFFPRHGVPVKYCREMRHEIKSVLKGEKRFCVRGDVGWQEGSGTINWVYDGVKSPKGRSCWFDDC